MLSHPDFKEKSIVIVFSIKDNRFSFRNDNIIVKNEEDKVILQTTCYKILALWIVGNCTITNGLLERSKKFAFPVLLLSYNFRCIGVWNSQTEGNFLLRNIQYSYNDWLIARHLVRNKITNQILLLKSVRKKSDKLKDAIKKLSFYRDSIEGSNELQLILGIEGVASRLYFSNWFDNIDWSGRKPRAKRDPANVLLDIGYSFLFYFVENMLNLYGFDLYQGVYHRNFYKRKSLVCDIQEPFRCIIEKQIKNAFSLGQVNIEDFRIENGQYALKYNKSKEYTKWLLSAIIERKSDIFIYCQKYYRAFIRQKPITEYPFFLVNNKIKH